EIDVARRLVGVEADLHLRGSELEALLDDPADLVDRALAVAANRRVERDFPPPPATEELPHRLAERLALQIPQREVDGGEGAGVRALRAELDVLMEEPILEHACLQRIGAEQHRRERARHDLERGVAVHHRARLAEAVCARVAPDPDPGAAAPALTPAYVERFDARDLHGLPPGATIVSFR